MLEFLNTVKNRHNKIDKQREHLGTNKMLRDKQKVHQYYTKNGLIRLRIEESGQGKIITYMVDLQNLFPDIKIDSL